VSMTSSVCGHPERAEAERLLASGHSMRSIAAQLGIGKTSLGRHVRSGHVPVLVVAEQNAERELHAIDIGERIEYLWRKASAILEQGRSRRPGDDRALGRP
jgi:hypothetical protein